MSTTTNQTSAESSSTKRITALDVLRGIAIIGIIPVNVQAISSWGYGQDVVLPATADATTRFLNLAISGRMMPLFALLFGIGFELFLASAIRRVDRAHIVMLRRLVFLLLVGIVHLFFNPGEVLAYYAFFGILVLLPASTLNRGVAAAIGVVLLVLTAPFSGPVTIPGLFLVGAATTRFDLIARLAKDVRLNAFIFGGFAIAAAVAVWFQLPVIELGDFSKVGRVAGLLTMFTLFTGVLLVMNSTPVARVLEFGFVSLGRMAFTVYLSTTAIVWVFGRLTDAPMKVWHPTDGLWVAAALIPVLWLFSTVWLRFFNYGPLEWVWRSVTWRERQPLRKNV